MEAHCGAVLAGRWNYEGTALVTGKLSAETTFKMNFLKKISGGTKCFNLAVVSLLV